MNTRRSLLASAALIFPVGLLAGCVGTGSAAEFDTAKAYFHAVSIAVLAAGQQALTGMTDPKAPAYVAIQTAMLQLQEAMTTIDATTTVADWRSAAAEAIGVVTKLADDPFVAAMLGGAAAYVPLAIGIVQAFISSLVLPPNTPPTPPAALARKGMEFHPNGRGALQRHGKQT